ncbi:retrovirus-related pol polyprotein from transposon TNT 1-94 [Tanacetum coccineum]
MDLCGPMRTESINGKKYVLVIVDDYTRFGWVRFLRKRDETSQVMRSFIVKTQRALNATVRFVRTDNGTEFVNKTLDGWFESVGSKASTPQQMTSVQTVQNSNLLLYSQGRSRSAHSNKTQFHQCPAYSKKQVDDLFQWFDDDEVVPIPPVVPITPVNVPAAPAPENAIGQRRTYCCDSIAERFDTSNRLQVQDDCVSFLLGILKRSFGFYVRESGSTAAPRAVRKEMLLPPGFRMNAHAWSRTALH